MTTGGEIEEARVPQGASDHGVLTDPGADTSTVPFPGLEGVEGTPAGGGASPKFRPWRVQKKIRTCPCEIGSETGEKRRETIEGTHGGLGVVLDDRSGAGGDQGGQSSLRPELKKTASWPSLRLSGPCLLSMRGSTTLRCCWCW